MKSLKKYRFLIRFVIKVLTVFILVWAVITFVITPHRMSDNRMFPGVRDGDLGFFYQLDRAYVGDVILYKAGNGFHVGRVIACGTQTVDFPEIGGYTVNGYVPFEEIPYETYGTDTLEYPMYVPENSVFVLNDFRSNTSDSRTYGVIPEENIHGKLMFLLRRRNF